MKLYYDRRSTAISKTPSAAGELVLVGSHRREGVPPSTWEERALKDGSRWQVYKRYFLGEELGAELGGSDVLHEGRYVVVVRA